MQGHGACEGQMKLPDTVNRHTIQALIDDWIVGDKAERDREIMAYRLIDGLTIEQIADRYQEQHPDCPLSSDTIKRAIRRREKQIFTHFPG